jgi:exosortase
MSQTQINEVGLSSVVGASDRMESSTVAADPLILGIHRSTWIQIGVITVLFSALFWPNLRRLWDKTNPFYGEANWGHAMCIPFIGLYYLYVNREKLLNPQTSTPVIDTKIGLRVWSMLAIALLLPLVLIREELNKIFLPAAITALMLTAALLPFMTARKSRPLIEKADEHSAGWFGGFIIFFGIAMFQYAIFPGQNDFLKDFGMVITLFGVVLTLSGWGVMKVAWFPIAFLVCGLPWPGLVYSKVAEPLQQLAATVAVWTLQLTGVEATVGGTKISMIGGDGQWRTLNVAEACAGMRSLMTFISVAAAVAFLSHRPLWQKIIVVVFAVPIAISCNVMRVSGQGLLDRYVSRSLSENFAHQFVGLIMLIPAFLLILLVGWVLDQIFVEQIDRRVTVIAPKVITRAAPAAPSAVAPRNSAPRSLASVRAADPSSAAGSSSTPTASPAKTAPVTAAPAKIAPIHAAPSKTSLPKPPPRPMGGGKGFVPPPPSVRLAPRAARPKKGPGESGGGQSPRERQ